MISFLIIVPTLDSHSLLPALVSSLQRQTIGYWRVLFIDGGSKTEHCQMLDYICQQDSRFTWEKQLPRYKGIYGAMNQGLQLADALNDWVLFWGSDDMAAGPNVLEKLFRRLTRDISSGTESDLYVCKARYCRVYSKEKSALKAKAGRISMFKMNKSFRKSLFWGSTPPHQGTVFGPKARQVLRSFDTHLRLAADLDYFLKISGFPQIKVEVVDLVLVMMGDCGISAKQNQRRLREVKMAYQKTFGNKWFIPFLLRYLQRLQSFLAIAI